MRRLVALLTLLLLAACGYKGPLYLPSAKPVHTEPAHTEPASADPAKADNTGAKP